MDQTIRHYSPKEFASIIGVSTSTLRRWEKEGLVTSLRTAEGERLYTSDMVERHQKQKEYQAYLKSQLSKKRIATEDVHHPQPLFHRVIENWHKIGLVMFVLSLLFTLIAGANILKNTPLEKSSWLRPLQSVLAAFDRRVPQFNSLFSVGTPARPVRADTDPDSIPTPTVPPSPYSGISVATLRDLYTDLVARFDAFTVQNPITNYQGTNSPTPTPILDITSFPHRSHSSLTNLTNSDDHTQYLYGSGRAGGQTLVGGINANDILTLQSSTATTGTGSGEKALKIIVGSGGETEALTILNNGNIGFQKTNPGFTLDVGGIINASAIYTNGTPMVSSQWTTTGSNIFYTTGNVGIGTSTPTTSLDIAGTLKTTGLTFPTGAVAGYVLTTDANGVASWTDVSSTAGPWGLTGNNLYPDSASNNLAIGATDSGSAKLYVNGNVGIGTTAPGASLNVVANAIGTVPGLIQGYSSGQTADLLQIAKNPGATPSFVFTSAGNLGIGTTSPGARLAINSGSSNLNTQISGSDIYFTRSSDAGVAGGIVFDGTNELKFRSWAADGRIVFNDASGETVRITAGKVGIGTTAPTYSLDVKSTGTDIARFTGTNSTGCTLSDGGVIACSSDRNLKKNIVDTNLGLDAVMNLRPVEFNWNSQAEGDKKYLGFIAQDVEQIAPSLVATDSNGYKQLNSIGLIPLVAKAIQEQQEILNQVQDDTRKAQHDIGDVKEQTLTLSELTTKVNAWDAIIIPLQTIVKEIQDMFISLQTQLGLVRADVDNTKEQVASLSASLHSMNVDYTSWKEAIASGSGVLGASDSALLDKVATISSLLVQNETTTFDLTVLNKLTSGVIEIGAGVAGDEINSAGGIRFQTLAQGPIDFMNGKVVIDVDGSITAKHLKLDTTDFASSTAGKSTLKAGKSTMIVDTSSVGPNSLVFLTPITLTDIPMAVTQKSTGIGFTVTIPQTISKDLEFQWLVIN